LSQHEIAVAVINGVDLDMSWYKQAFFCNCIKFSSNFELHYFVQFQVAHKDIAAFCACQIKANKKLQGKMNFRTTTNNSG